MQKSANPPKIERTLVIIKPDGLWRGLWQPIRFMIKDSGLNIVSSWYGILRTEDMVSIYGPQHAKEHYFEKLIRHMVSGDVEILLVEGTSAIGIMLDIKNVVRTIFKPGKEDFPRVPKVQNILHASDKKFAGSEVDYFTRVVPLLNLVRNGHVVFSYSRPNALIPNAKITNRRDIPVM